MPAGGRLLLAGLRPVPRYEIVRQVGRVEDLLEPAPVRLDKRTKDRRLDLRPAFLRQKIRKEQHTNSIEFRRPLKDASSHPISIHPACPDAHPPKV